MIKPFAIFFYPRKCDRCMQSLEMPILPAIVFIFYHVNYTGQKPKEHTPA